MKSGMSLKYTISQGATIDSLGRLTRENLKNLIEFCWYGQKVNFNPY